MGNVPEQNGGEKRAKEDGEPPNQPKWTKQTTITLNLQQHPQIAQAQAKSTHLRVRTKG